MEPGEVGQRRREMGDAERKRRAEPDRAGDLGDRLGDHLLRGFEVGEDSGGAGIIGLADVGRLGAARGAGQQARAEMLLEPSDAAGQDGLRQAHPFGGAGERTGFGHPHKGENVDEIGELSVPYFATP